MMLRLPGGQLNAKIQSNCKQQAHAVPKVDAPVRAAARHSSSRPMQVAHTSSSHFPSTSYGEEGGGPQQERHRVYIFDPESPGDIEESHLEPHPERDRAHELLALEEAGDTSSSWALARQQAGEEQLAMKQRESKALEMQRALVEQLDLEQRQVLELQRYEGLYKEVMMRADRSEADVAYMQSMVAEKDAELAHTYKLLEASAQERSRLRMEHQAAQERMRDLQAQLIQAQAQLRAPKAQSLASASPTPPPSSSGSSLDEAVEELTNLAYSLAMDMSEDIRTMYPDRATPGPQTASSTDDTSSSSFPDPGISAQQPSGLGLDGAPAAAPPPQPSAWFDSESPGPGFAHSRQW